jgi:hypothetical protein
MHGHRVDGEIAACQILQEAVAEANGRAPVERGIPLCPIRRDLDRHPSEDEPDRPERLPHGIDAFRARFLAETPGLFRMRRRGVIEIGHRTTEEEIAYDTTDEVQLVPGSRERASEAIMISWSAGGSRSKSERSGRVSSGMVLGSLIAPLVPSTPGHCTRAPAPHPR